MNTDTLKTFVTLAKIKNFTQTSRQLFVSQSTVTNRINDLEHEVGTSLFTRTNRLVELTPAGRLFLAYAQKMIDLTDTSLAEITSSTKFKNSLRIGAAESIYETHLASLVLDYKKEHSEDALRISIGLSMNLLEQLQNNILDVVFTYLPLSKHQYKSSVFMQDNMVLVTDYENPAFQNGIHKEELPHIDYLMCNFALQDVGQFIRGLFPRYHQFSLEIDDCSKIIPFLLHQDSYTFLPRDLASPYIVSKKLRMVSLIDFMPPVINSYIIGNTLKESLWKQVFYHTPLLDSVPLVK